MKKRFPLQTMALLAASGALFSGCLSQNPESPSAAAEKTDHPAMAAATTFALNYGWQSIVQANPSSDVGAMIRTPGKCYAVGGVKFGNNYPIQVWDGAWDSYPHPSGAKGVGVDAAPDGSVWVVQDNKAIFSYPYNSSQATYRGDAKDIGIGADGSVWKIGTQTIPGTNDYTISKWNGGSDWQTPVSGGGVRLDVDYQGRVWIVNSANEVWKMKSDMRTFSRVDGMYATDIGCGAQDGQIFAVSTQPYNSAGDSRIYHYVSGVTWESTNGGGYRVSVDNQGFPWLATKSGMAYNAYQKL